MKWDTSYFTYIFLYNIIKCLKIFLYFSPSSSSSLLHAVREAGAFFFCVSQVQNEHILGSRRRTGQNSVVFWPVFFKRTDQTKKKKKMTEDRGAPVRGIAPGRRSAPPWRGDAYSQARHQWVASHHLRHAFHNYGNNQKDLLQRSITTVRRCQSLLNLLLLYLCKWIFQENISMLKCSSFINKTI